jgi:hypothetical protein
MLEQLFSKDHPMHRTFAWLAACLLLPAEAAWAHPGHGVTPPDSPAHYVLEPLHALPVLLIVLAIVGVRVVSRRRARAVRREEKDDV